MRVCQQELSVCEFDSCFVVCLIGRCYAHAIFLGHVRKLNHTWSLKSVISIFLLFFKKKNCRAFGPLKLEFPF